MSEKRILDDRPNANEIVREALRTEVKSLLEQCSNPQREMFGRVFPLSLDKMPEDELRTAVDLCQRTVRKNITTGRLGAQP